MSATTASSSASAVNTQYKVILGTVFGIIIANTAVLLRLFARRAARLSLKLDDYFICAALFFHWGLAIAGIFLLQYGLGLPLSATTPEALTKYLKVLFSGSFLYSATIFFTKASILYLYHRTFPSFRVRLPVYATGVIILVWFVVCCVAGAVVCVPLERLWNPTAPGHCFNLTQFYVGIQIPNVITDIIIFIIPLPVIVRLPLPLYQRWSLVFIFGVGLLTIIFDIVRLVFMIELSNSTEDATLAEVDPSVWTCIEPAVGILAACLSNMRPLLKFFHKRIYSPTQTETQTAVASQQDSHGLRTMETYDSYEGAAPVQERKMVV